MNTDKIYAEQLANEYAPKGTSKVVALRKLDARAKITGNNFYLHLWHFNSLNHGCRNVSFDESDRERNNSNIYCRYYYRHHRIGRNGNQLPNLQENVSQWKTKICL